MFEQGSDADGNLRHPETLGFVDRPRQGGTIYRVELAMAFARVTTKDLTAAVRQALRKAVAEELGLPLPRVTFGRVSNPSPASGGFLVVRMEVAPGPDENLVARLRRFPGADAPLLEAVRAATCSTLGQLDEARSSVSVEDITPVRDPLPLTEPSTAIVEAVAPKMEIHVPYASYRLVRSDGSEPDRTDKHPFCMSRVYYDSSEKPEEVRWVAGVGKD